MTEIEAGAGGGRLRALRTIAARWARLVVDAILPPRCLACGAETLAGPYGPAAVCADCWRTLTPIAPPLCDGCGLPFEIPVDAEPARCGACLAEPPSFDRARAALLYDDASKRLVLSFKHADATHAAPALAAWMAVVARTLVDEADLIVPVPLHRRRLLRRRYNQAALLALAIGRLRGKPVAVDLLCRVRPTASQGTHGRAARLRNLRGAIAVRPKAAAAVAGRRVLLVDDVLTTGATVGECARVLKRAGAASVDVAVIARVPGPAD